MADSVGLGAQAPSLQEALQPISSLLTIQNQKEQVKQAKLKTQGEYGDVSKKILGGLYSDERIRNADKDPQAASQALIEGYEDAVRMGVPKEVAMSFAAPLFSVAQHAPKNLPNIIRNTQLGNVGTQQQLEKAYPAITQTDVGAQIMPIATGNPTLAQTAPGTVVGQGLNKSLAPQVFTSPYSGGAQVIGGVGGLGYQLPQQNQPSQPSGQSVVSGMQSAFNTKTGQGGGVLQPLPGEVPEAYKARTADVLNISKNAQSTLDASNPSSVVNMQTTNKKIDQLLDKKDLDIGPIANAIKNKTGGVGLSTDQQIIYKYLEQRVLQTGAGSDAQRDAQRTAFGSFANNKDALRTILGKDNGVLKGQELLSRGALNYQGNANNPNLQAVNNFKNKFVQLADPETLHLIGVIGENPNIKLSESQRNHLKSEFGSLSKDEFNVLMAKRKAILNLVNGGQ